MTVLAEVIAAAYVVDALDAAIRDHLVDRRWFRNAGRDGGKQFRWTDWDKANDAALLALLRVRSAAKRRAGR